MSERLIAIGDIHGCRTALRTLLSVIDPQPEDIVVTLGDYVDRGPDSKGVVDELIELGKQTQLVSLIGNHEEMMLNVVCGRETHYNWIQYGGVSTLDSYGFDGGLDFLPPEHIQFFESLGDYFLLEDYFFTHASYDPQIPLDQQDTRTLRWKALTEGIPSAHESNKIAVVGHTAQRDGEVLDLGHLLCIDTFCYGGGWLTGLDLRSRTLWQASDAGQVRGRR